MDDALSPVRIRAVFLGHGRYQVEGERQSAKLHEMQELRRTLVASGIQKRIRGGRFAASKKGD
jgi:hypothetical protein